MSGVRRNSLVYPRAGKADKDKGKNEDPRFAQRRESRSENGKFAIDLPLGSLEDNGNLGGIGDPMGQVAGAFDGHMMAVFSTKRIGKSATQSTKEAAATNPQVPMFKSQQPLTLQGRPGIERRSDDGRTSFRGYASGTRTYVVSILVQGRNIDEAVVSGFFDSFKILE